MLRGPELGRGPAEAAPRGAELARDQGASAVVALVAPGSVEPAVRAGPDEIAVGEEALMLRAVRVLLRSTSDEPAFEELEEDLLDGLRVQRPYGCR